jgi:hypothetical protein
LFFASGNLSCRINSSADHSSYRTVALLIGTLFEILTLKLDPNKFR